MVHYRPSRDITTAEKFRRNLTQDAGVLLRRWNRHTNGEAAARLTAEQRRQWVAEAAVLLEELSAEIAALLPHEDRQEHSARMAEWRREFAAGRRAVRKIPQDD